MGKRLTNKQWTVLYAIKYYISKNGFSPTVRELADILGIKSTSTMHGYLERLENLGYITKGDGSPRNLRIISEPTDFTYGSNLTVPGIHIRLI